MAASPLTDDMTATGSSTYVATRIYGTTAATTMNTYEICKQWITAYDRDATDSTWGTCAVCDETTGWHKPAIKWLTTACYDEDDTRFYRNQKYLQTIYRMFTVRADCGTWGVASRPSHLEGQLRQIIAERQAPAFFIPRRNQSKALPDTTDERELRARETLRRLIGDMQYRQLQERGFIMVRGDSGKWYRLKPGHHFADVYQHGEQIDRLCINLTGDFPPTDTLLMRVMMVWNAEEDFWKIANKHGPAMRTSLSSGGDQRPLNEIVAGLRREYPGVPLLAKTRQVA